jgi:hypothetical protein
MVGRKGSQATAPPIDPTICLLWGTEESPEVPPFGLPKPLSQLPRSVGMTFLEGIP